jgi:hypothetical protein
MAEPAANGGEFPQPDAHDRIIRAHAAIAHQTAVGADDLARPTLAHLMGLAKVSHSLPPGGGRFLWNQRRVLPFLNRPFRFTNAAIQVRCSNQLL